MPRMKRVSRPKLTDTTRNALIKQYLLSAAFRGVMVLSGRVTRLRQMTDVELLRTVADSFEALSASEA